MRILALIAQIALSAICLLCYLAGMVIAMVGVACRMLCDWLGKYKCQCTGCKYELDHEGKKVCRTMTRKHGQGCDAYTKGDK